MKYRFAEMIWYETREAAEQERVAVLPVATYEDHGPHLPVDTDVVLCTGICERAVARIPSESVLAPPVPHGYSPHHMDFHGTLTIDLYQVCQRCMLQPCASRVQTNPHCQRSRQQHLSPRPRSTVDEHRI